MIEIVCPNCKARYQLPDGAIGPEGRKVSCSSCTHKWRAYAEAADTATPPAPAASPAPVSTPPPVVPPAETAPAAVAAREPAAGAPPEDADDDLDDSPPASPMPPPATGNRDEQMAAIRKMLSDLKEAADTGSETTDDAGGRAGAQAATPGTGPSAKRRDEEVPNRNRLEDRIDDVDKLAKMVKGEPTGDGYDATRLRKRHEKRAKRLQRAREQKKKSGAFLTGFTLVAVVATVMVGLYVMHPKIIAASPELEPALTEYVNTIDRYRVEFAATTEEWKAWLTERIGNLRKKAEEQG